MTSNMVGLLNFGPFVIDEKQDQRPRISISISHESHGTPAIFERKKVLRTLV